MNESGGILSGIIRGVAAAVAAVAALAALAALAGVEVTSKE